MSSLADWTLAYQGKVRDVYIPLNASSMAESDRLLIVATDRVSAFDVVLRPDIPGKGEILTEISTWWMKLLPDVPNHLLAEAPPAELASRAVVAKSLSMLPVECIVRGYLAGTGWKEYQSTGRVCGIELPKGLSEGDALPEPLFTPATKAALGDHDENISYDQMAGIVGVELARSLQQRSLEIFRRASDVAQRRGLILADTKFEFGLEPGSDTLVLADEVLTPDSSRYWDHGAYQAGGPDRLASFDKQIVRDWLRAHWDMTGEPPELPTDIVGRTALRYRQLRDTLCQEVW